MRFSCSSVMRKLGVHGGAHVFDAIAPACFVTHGGSHAGLEAVANLAGSIAAAGGRGTEHHFLAGNVRNQMLALIQAEIAPAHGAFLQAASRMEPSA